MPANSLNVIFWYTHLQSSGPGYPLLSETLIAATVELIDPHVVRIVILWLRLNNIPESEKYFKRVLELKPNDAPALNYLGYTYADKGIKLDEAEKMIEKALEIEPESGYYWDSLGWVHYRMGDLEKAKEELLKALGFLSTEGIIYDHIGDVYRDLGEIEKAREMWQKALENNTEKPEETKAKLKQ